MLPFFERAIAPRHFLLGKGHLMRKFSTGSLQGHQGNDQQGHKGNRLRCLHEVSDTL